MLQGKHVASRMQCELIRMHIAWAFVESNNHCDLNQKALMVAFRLSRNKCQALVDPVHPDLCTPWCTLIAVYIDKATDTAHVRAFRFGPAPSSTQPRSGESQLVFKNLVKRYSKHKLFRFRVLSMAAVAKLPNRTRGGCGSLLIPPR